MLVDNYTFQWNIMGHKISMENVEIIDKENQYRKMCILEMIHIKRSSNSLNKQSPEYIQNTYNNII